MRTVNNQGDAKLFGRNGVTTATPIGDTDILTLAPGLRNGDNCAWRFKEHDWFQIVLAEVRATDLFRFLFADSI